MPTKNKFCLGFMFNPSADRVVLIRKTHPEWQKNSLNGIGGKIKANESCIQAMVREFAEETGVKTEPSDWNYFCVMTGLDWEVYCYSSNSFMAEDVRTTTEEIVDQFLITHLHEEPIIKNLSWLIPMALDGQFNAPVIVYPK